MTLDSKLEKSDSTYLIRKRSTMDEVYLLVMTYETEKLGIGKLDPSVEQLIWGEDYHILFDRIYTPKKSSEVIFREIIREKTSKNI